MARKISLLNSRVSQLQQEIKPEFVAETDTGRLRQRYRLHEKIVQYFNIDELRSLMKSLGINPEHISDSGERLDNQAMEFVLYMARHNKTSDLLKRLEQKRPSIKWR